MKAETPQILWHNGTDNEQNKNAPVFSISLLESGIRTSTNKYGIVLATAGNHEVNLWKMKLCPQGNELYSKLDRNVPYKMVKVDLLTTLTRHSSTVNVVRFSPNGLHLASASDSGSIIIYSVPPTKRGGGNGRHYWSEVENEQQLSIKVLSGNYAIYDLDWSMDSRRLLVGTLDHCISVYEDENYTLNHHTLGSSDLQKESQWICVYRNARDHTHYVQGVAMDPQGVYVTSMSCDRTVRVFARKMIKKRKVLSDRLELGKGKTIKYYSPKEESSLSPADASDKSSSKRIPLFAEEAASESFFRRLTWTADGAYLITPTALWKDQCATLIFRRHCYDAPCKVLPGHDKPSRAVAANPVAFHLPDGVSQYAGLPYKSVFAVLTEISILIYDTYHNMPIALARGLHYSGLTDAMWTPDGHALIVCSSDGYLSFIVFEEGELGRVYQKTSHSMKPEVKSSNVIHSESQKDYSPRVISPTGKVNPSDQYQAKPKETAAETKINILQPRKRILTPTSMQEGIPISDTDRPVIKEATSESHEEKAKSHCFVNNLQPRKIKRVTTKVVID